MSEFIVVPDDELRSKVDEFEISLLLIKNKEIFLKEYDHDILKTVSLENSESIFSVYTDLKYEDFICLLQNKHAQKLLTLKDSFDQTPIEKDFNDLNIYLTDVKEYRSEMSKVLLNVLKDFNEKDRGDAIEKLLMKKFKSGLSAKKDFIKFLKNIKQAGLNNTPLDFSQLTYRMYHSDFSAFSNINIIKEMVAVYPSKELAKQIMIYTGSLEILNEVSPKISSVKDIIEIEAEHKKIKPVMNEDEENEKNNFLKMLKISVEKKEIITELGNKEKPEELMNIRKRI